MIRFLTESSFGPVGLTREDAGIAIPSERKLRLWAQACLCPSECSIYTEHLVDKADLGELLRHILLCHREDRKDQVNIVKAALLRDIIGNPWKPVMLADPVDWMGFPPGPHYKLPRSWLTPPVLALARDAYEERGRKCERCDGQGWYWTAKGSEPAWKEDCSTCHGTGHIEDGHLDPGTLGILADALDEAGCDNVDLLMHLRGREIRYVRHNLGPYDYELQPKWCALRGPHGRGCWALDLVLGKD